MTGAANNAAQRAPSNTSLISRVAHRLVWHRLESLVEGRATDLQVYHLEDITAHYAETLVHWRQRCA